MENNFETALVAFIADSQAKINVHYAKDLSTCTPPTLVFTAGRKNVKILRQETNGRSVWTFIEIATGNILKPATFNAPAKHARGNIFQPETWTTVTAYRPAYLR
jgi:hypothetical protein